MAEKVFGKCEVYIFGSRLKEKKGGDIDIFVVPDEREKLFEKRIKLEAKLENLLGKPVDVVVSRDFNRPIEKEALKGVRIN
ncbi:nucleotidyltransferase family protein [Hippea sp. KM1]|uniref:nucleotidyltransferase family protein n=1 Tax=Hippea sp. KM1 TaxID=944481 RepID=UPI0018DC2AAF